MDKCPKLFVWIEGESLPRLNGIFKTMKECNSEKLYLLEGEEDEEEGYIGVIVGAHSRKEAIDFICREATINGKRKYLNEDEGVKKRVKLWNEDLPLGDVSEDGPPLSDFF